MRNSHSRSFKVTHFGITEKPTTDCVSLYNNACLISKVSKEIASENAENCRCQQLDSSLMPLPREPPRISAQTLHWQIVESLPYILPLILWVYLDFTFCGGLRKTHLFCNRVRIGCSRSSRSLTLAPIERAYATYC